MHSYVKFSLKIKGINGGNVSEKCMFHPLCVEPYTGWVVANKAQNPAKRQNPKSKEDERRRVSAAVTVFPVGFWTKYVSVRL